MGGAAPGDRQVEHGVQLSCLVLERVASGAGVSVDKVLMLTGLSPLDLVFVLAKINRNFAVIFFRVLAISVLLHAAEVVLNQVHALRLLLL